MQLLANEKMIASLNDDKVELSNMRLQLVQGYDYKIINLNQISYIETEERKKTLLLILAIIGIVAGVFSSNMGGGDDAMVFFVVGAVFFFGYMIFPDKNIVVRSSGGTIRHKVTWIRKQDVDRFIFLVQQEMNRK